MRANKRPDTYSLGHLAYLQLRPALRPIWLGSAWAALCGAVASGGLSFTGEGLLFLLLILFLADPLLGALWALITTTDWFSPLTEGTTPLTNQLARLENQADSQLGLRRALGLRLGPKTQSRRRGELIRHPVEVALPRPPYTMEGSLSHRAFAWLEEALAWWRGLFWPKLGTSLLSLIMALVLALVLAVILGQEVLLLVVIALALAAMEVLFSRPRADTSGDASAQLAYPDTTLEAQSCCADASGAAQPFLRACSAMGVPWLMGHLGLGPLSWPSLLLAFLYTGAYCACLSLEKGNSRSAIAILNAVQVSVIILLILLQRPIPAGVLGLLLLPQLLLQPLTKQLAGPEDQTDSQLDRGELIRQMTNQLRRQGLGLWYLQRTQFFLMAGMIVAAGAVMGF